MTGKQDRRLGTLGSPERILFCLILVTVGLFLLPLVFITEFAYQRSWVSAHFATMARSFMENGVFELGFLPVQNGGPLTVEPDYYFHWPPLFPIVLSWCFAAVGQASIFTVHAVSTFFVGCQAALIGFWIKRRLSLFAALVAVLSFLNLPVVAKFAHVGLQLHLAFLLAFASILIFDHAARQGAVRPWIIAAGAIGYSLACFTSWEPILALPGLAVYWLIKRTWHTGILVLTYSIAGFAAFAATLLLYFLQYPNVLMGLFNRALYRAGIASYTDTTATTIHDIGSVAPIDSDFTFAFLVENSLSNLSLIGAAGLALIALVPLSLHRKQFLDSSGEGLFVLLPLMTMGGLWIVLMPQHFSVHDYQTISFAIPVALATGFLARFLQVRFIPTGGAPFKASKHAPGLVLIFGFALIVMRLSIDIEKFSEFEPELDPTVFLGNALAQEIPENGLVAVPWKNMVQTFYSDRHIVRGIATLEMFEANRDRIARLCTTCPLFLVLDDDSKTVPQDGYETIWQRDRWRFLKVSARGTVQISQ